MSPAVGENEVSCGQHGVESQGRERTPRYAVPWAGVRAMIRGSDLQEREAYQEETAAEWAAVE